MGARTDLSSMPRNDTARDSGDFCLADSLFMALKGLEASDVSKKLPSSSPSQDQYQDQGTERSSRYGSASGSSLGLGYLSTAALASSATLPCTPSSTSELCLPLVSEVGHDLDHHDVKWYHLTEIKDRGLGLTAARRIPAGTLILSEPALIKISLWEEQNDSSAIDKAVKALTKSERKQYLQLFNAKDSGQTSQATGIYNSNCYDIRAFDDGGGSCIGFTSSRINHSCLPNVNFTYVPADQVTTALMTKLSLSPVDHANALRHGIMQFYAIKTISKGKELLSNYEKSIFATSKARIERLRRHYGFECSCEACVPTSDFWKRSDVRRKEMEECVKAGAAYEREWMARAVHDVQNKSSSLAENAIAKLLKLEGLLQKEGLTYTPLANCYKSLAKWTTRLGQHTDAILWMQKEQDVVVRCLGRDSRRAQALANSMHHST